MCVCVCEVCVECVWSVCVCVSVCVWSVCECVKCVCRGGPTTSASVFSWTLSR